MMKTILVMDEDGAVRESLRAVLQADGYKVMLVTCGPKALAALDPAAVDLFLLDVTLPLRHGWEEYQRFVSRNPDLPVILLDGHAGTAQAPLPVGARVFLEKPVDVPQLIGHIRRLLQEQGADRGGCEAGGGSEARSVEQLRAHWMPVHRWSQRIQPE